MTQTGRGARIILLSDARSVRRAFTLLELLVVLVLISISAAATVPQLNGTLGRWQLRETARNLQMTLEVAAQWAGVRQEAVVFALDAARGTFRLRLPAPGRAGGRGALPAGRQSLGRSVAIARMEGLTDQGAEKVLVFGPDGTSPAATIVLTNGRAQASRETSWQIVLDGRGAVRCREGLDDETTR
jgi:prepilin-type N-terminal cleavage/methylation domain-containing protein